MTLTFECIWLYFLAETLYCDSYHVGGTYCYCKADSIPVPLNGTECVDVDECKENNGGCEQMCNNTVGSFTCSCESGYTKSVNGFSCGG